VSMIRISMAALLVLSASCASKSADTNKEVGAVQPKVRRNPNVISQEELQAPAITSRDALSAIRQLRPNFFSYRGPTGSMEPGAGEVQVSHDYGPLQPVSTLKSLNTFGLVEVRYLNAEDAALRFGLNANGGPVIVLLANKSQ
jgi:hypothetical protein